MAKTRTKKPDPGRKLAIELARLAESRNGEHIVVLDLREISPITDYFVIVTGTSDRQLRALSDEMKTVGKGLGSPAYNVAGAQSAQWIVLDFVDVVVHLFDDLRRKYYDLELIWGDAPHIRWRAPRKKNQAEPDAPAAEPSEGS